MWPVETKELPTPVLNPFYSYIWIIKTKWYSLESVCVILYVLPSIQTLLVVYNCQSHYEIYAVHFSVLEEHRYSSLIPPPI